MHRRIILKKNLHFLTLLAALALLGAGVLVGAAQAQAQSTTLHPDFPLLDESGEPVQKTGQPISTMETCGACHDTAFIVEHSGHADAGLQSFSAPGGVEGGRSWDTSSGWFGGWNPLA
ncbi:MAG TPA: hypothetical protein VJ768_04255, partial [Anaerolineales bacterium]|nr:hypothetical protein [Anaerolineales bacterium]